MDNSSLIAATPLTRIPQPLIFTLILLWALPFTLFQLGFNFQTTIMSQTLLQSLGFSFGLLTALLTFIQYKLCKDKLSLVIGCTLLFSAVFEVINVTLLNTLPLTYIEKTNLNSWIWIYSNGVSGFIFLIGLSLLIYRQNIFKMFLLSSLLFFFGAFIIAVSFYGSSYLKLQNIDFWPYELGVSAIYLFLIFSIYTKMDTRFFSMMSHCVFYMACTQLVSAIYLMLSTFPYDMTYNSAYFIKLLFYFIPFVCLVIHYSFSHSSIINAEKRLKIQQKELKYIASHDSLTNLFNRREFEELLDKSIANAARNNTSLALLLMDLDNFNTVNETLGFIHGNDLLKQFSRRLGLLIRKGDLLSRIGGDEFTIISLNLKSPSSARQLAQRILNEIHSPYPLADKLITMTVSIGISLFPNDGNTTEDLLRKADLALCKSKQSGKNFYQFYTEQMSISQHRESEIETHLRKALQNDEFQLYYQPKYNLLTQKIVGAEILLRWDNKALGLISPNEFIPIAESTGLIINLGQWILRKSCEQIMKWNQLYRNELEFSVNISPSQLLNNQFLINLEKILKDYDYPSQYLEFEITEHELIIRNDEIHQALNRISDLGIKISLDDFGKAYSSLNRLKTLPIDTLKIDKEFISDIHNANEKVVIVDLIIKLANELGMSVIAEGIETSEQLKYLIEKKCYLGQGNYLSKALSAEEFAQLAYQKEELVTRL